MAGKGKRFNFHGSFNKKADAVAKEKEVSGPLGTGAAFIREKKVGGHVRYFVLTSK